jgi:hypothetical protein
VENPHYLCGVKFKIMAVGINGNTFDKAHPGTQTGTGEKPGMPGGFFQKLIKFALDNPLVSIMSALVILGVLLPGDKKKRG